MSVLQWTPAGLQELIEDLLRILEPHGRLRPYLFLADDERETAVPLDELLFKNGNQRFIRNTLPHLARDFGPDGATRAAFVCSSWATDFAPDDLAASHSYRLHLANGGTLSTWPGRVEALSAIVVERGKPSWALIGLLERHEDTHPTISSWETSEVERSGPIVVALERGVRSERSLYAV